MGAKIITEPGVGVYVALLLLWGHAQIAMAWFIASIFSG